MNVLPGALPTLAATALSETQADPRHRTPPSRRQARHTALSGAAEPAPHTARHWRAVLAAESVVPPIGARCPDEELPPAWLAAAIGVLAG